MTADAHTIARTVSFICFITTVCQKRVPHAAAPYMSASMTCSSQETWRMCPRDTCSGPTVWFSSDLCTILDASAAACSASLLRLALFCARATRRLLMRRPKDRSSSRCSAKLAAGRVSAAVPVKASPDICAASDTIAGADAATGSTTGTGSAEATIACESVLRLISQNLQVQSLYQPQAQNSGTWP